MDGMDPEVSPRYLIATLVALSGDEGFADIPPDAPLREQGLDSLAHFKFLLELEKQFSTSISDEDFAFSRTGTINGICEVLRKYV